MKNQVLSYTDARGLAAACLLFAWAVQNLAQGVGSSPSVSAIYAFGDCLTDTHNAEPVPFFSWQGRYSNGPMWFDQGAKAVLDAEPNLTLSTI